MFDLTVLSPHRDDAVFSLYGLLASAVGSAKITVLNLFTRSAYAPLAPYSDPGTVTAIRKREDRRVLSSLGHLIKVVDGELLDAPLRFNISPSTVCNPDRQSLVTRDRIWEAGQVFQRAPSKTYFVPLALCNHIDHVAVKEAALLHLPSSRLAFYEDLPYAMWTSEYDVAERLRQIQRVTRIGLKPVSLRPLNATTQRRRAMSGYRSQVTSAEVNDMARWVNRFGLGERIWIPSHSRRLQLLMRKTYPLNPTAL